ncbi:lysoplasmalogenase family protein [Agrococcus sp. HG114]|uniref:lysoplasmalogenase family protein n=1 Tax=Agrococcus sp. HG114 TaxID=2969757 RepID=UPI00215AF6EC|nr:lysoplasmalogenase family protein [Agrococcus sp. HG114]MCR8671729.1 lysoplasmalogenase family protein [Agrococcus sp. HG114]
MPSLPRPLRAGLWVSGAVLAVNVLAAVLLDAEIGDEGVLTIVRGVTMWGLVPPIAVALVALGALRHAVGVWHVVAVVLCWLGDGIGSATGELLVLLGLFFVADLAFLAALWPTRRRSLAWGWAAVGYGVVAIISGGVIAAHAGPLAAAVVLFALLLAAVAALAAVDTAGLLGGLLLMACVLVLGIGVFVIEMPDALRALAVLVPYVAGQALLAVSLQQRLGLGAPATEAARAA